MPPSLILKSGASTSPNRRSHSTSTAARRSRGGTCEIVEGNGTQRNVVIEFASYADALAYAKSSEYAEAKALRQGAGSIDITVVEGV